MRTLSLRDRVRSWHLHIPVLIFEVLCVSVQLTPAVTYSHAPHTPIGLVHLLWTLCAPCV